MRDTSDAWARLRLGQPQPVIDITAWRGGSYVGPVEGILDVTITDQEDQHPRGTAEIRVDDRPTNRALGPDAVLSTAGTRLLIRKGLLDHRSGQVAAWVTLGSFPIEYVEPPVDHQIRVHARGPEWLLEQARFITPPTLAGTAANMLAALTSGIAPLHLDPALVDRPLGTRIWTEDDRLAAFREIVDAWPAVIAGSLDAISIRPSWPVTIAAEYPDGDYGSLIDLAITPDRATIPNAVIAQNPEGNIRAITYVASGELRWNGPYGQHPARFTSPLLTTVQAAQLAAGTRLRRLISRIRMVTATLIGDERLEVGDIVRLRRDQLDITARIVEITHRLTQHTTTLTGAIVGGLDEHQAPILSATEPGIVTITGPAAAPSPAIPRTATAWPISPGTWQNGAWRTDTAVLWQGDPTGRGLAHGGTWYGSQLAGITGLTIRLVREPSGTADTLPYPPTLTLLAGITRPDTTPTILDQAPGPALLPGGSTTWPVPPAWIPLLAAGAAGGIGCYSPSPWPPIGLTTQAGGMTATATY
jgi:hypothetical protein